MLVLCILMRKCRYYLAGGQVYFSELKYVYVETEAAYPPFALMCDIGGALGLILGSTVLTFCEFVDLLVTLAAAFLHVRSFSAVNRR